MGKTLTKGIISVVAIATLGGVTVTNVNLQPSIFEYPLLANTEIEKLEWVYAAQETLRLEHNKKGSEFRDGIISEAEWEAYKENEFDQLNMQLGEEKAKLRQKLNYDTFPVKAEATPTQLIEIERIESEKEKFKKSTKYIIDTKKILKTNIAEAANEDFTTYTETDPGADLTVTASKITALNLDDTVTSNVFYNYGADYFNALDVDYETRLETSTGGNTQFGPGFVNTGTPTTETRGTLATTDTWTMFYRYSTSYQFYLVRGAFVANDSSIGLSGGTVYYNTISRTAGSDSVSTLIYSDSARTTLLDTLTVAGYGTGTKWQYSYAFLMHTGSDGASGDGFVQNMNLNLSTPVVSPIIEDLLKYE